MQRFSRQIAARALVLVMIVVIPALAVIAYDQAADRRHAREQAVDDTSRLAHLAASEQSRIFGGVQRLLTTLALFPGLRDGDAAMCSAVLPTVLADHPSYINLFLVESDGAVVCLGSHRPLMRGASSTGTPAWISRVLASRTTVIGDYQLSLTTGRPAVVMAHPILGADGQVRRVIAAVVALDNLSATFEAVKLPRGATLTLTDVHGVILARTPAAAGLLGTRHAQFPTSGSVSSGDAREMRESVGSDGVRRLYTMLPVDRGVARDLFVTLDIESSAIFPGANRLLTGQLWLLALLTTAAIGVATVGGNALVLQPIKEREREAEERTRFALEVSKVGVWEHDGKSGRVFWSETLAALHGIQFSEFGGDVAGFLSCVKPDERDGILRVIGESVGGRVPMVTVEYTSIWPDGSEHRLTTTAHYSYDADGRLTRGAGVTVDVTEQRSLEAQLRQSQKMEAVGQLSGGIAHDFNNMLMAILASAEFLLDDIPHGDRRRADVEEIVKAGERAKTLTQQLLAFSRKRVTAPGVLHVGEVVAGVAPMLRRLLGESIDLQTTMADRGCVKADGGHLEQVLMNLAVNARDAMASGGRLTIDTSDVELDAAFVRSHSGLRTGPHVRITVTDSGHGMDAVTLAQIFEPFFTTKPAGVGTGLGLATVYSIVKQSGGHIAVESAPGAGTTFTVYLPQTAEREASRPASRAADAPRGTETIVVVEDEATVRDLVAKILTRQGYRVHGFDSPVKAISFVTANITAVDLILSDVVLPEMNGPAMISALVALEACPRIIYMSGYTGGTLLRSEPLTADVPFLQKPFAPLKLAVTVRQTLDARAASEMAVPA